MMKNLLRLAAPALLGLSMLGTAQADAQYRPDTRWEIGPVARGQNYSLNMPRNPAAVGNGWTFEFPYPVERAGHVHYITTPVRTLAGASEIRMRFRVDAQRGTRFVARARPNEPAAVTLYFQRQGDNWSGTGRYNYYRWFAPAGTMKQIRPGEYEVVASFRDPGWITVDGARTSRSDPRAFQDALVNAGRVGILFGSRGMRGHGVFATGPARFTMTDFQIR